MSTKDQLRTWLTVFDNATLCLQLHQYSWEEQDQKRQQARLLLDELGMGDTLSFYPHQLTPAMRQRTALVRTLVENKPIVLLDEPYSELDYSERAQLKEITARYLQGKTVIFITHEPTEALRFANEIIVMQGHPATLKSIATFSSATPRELSDPQLTAIHAILHGRLAEVE